MQDIEDHLTGYSTHFSQPGRPWLGQAKRFTFPMPSQPPVPAGAHRNNNFPSAALPSCLNPWLVSWAGNKRKGTRHSGAQKNQIVRLNPPPPLSSSTKYTTHAPALDLTTSLRGDFIIQHMTVMGSVQMWVSSANGRAGGSSRVFLKAPKGPDLT